MKKLLLLFAPAMLAAGCSQETEIAPPLEIGEDVTSEIPQRNVENAVYNDLTGMWMIPQADPYTLENFQAAYDNLASGKSIQTLTRAEAAEFSEGEQLEPTHFALRIYPKTEDEQWRVEMMEDVSVIYTPFNYSGLTEEEVAQVPQTRSEIASPFEVSPYTVTYDYTDATDGGTTGPITYQLPVMYAVWPAEKPLPDDLEYKVDYEVFLPHEASDSQLSNEAMQTLTAEAVAATVDVLYTRVPTKPLEPILNSPIGPPFTFFEGDVTTYDEVLKRDVPLANLKISSHFLGSYFVQTTTDASGHFTAEVCEGYEVLWLGGQLHPIDIDKYFPLTFTYQDPLGRWKVVPGDNGISTTIPYSVQIGAKLVETKLSPIPYAHITLPAGDRHINEIYRAANYFFNGQTDFTPPAITGGINIVAYTGIGRSGFLNDPLHLENPYIQFYKEATSASSIGAVLHELGHFAHYQHNRPQYRNIPKIFRESFASYSGWLLGEQYLTSLGWTNPNYYPNYADVIRQGRQSWYHAYDGENAWYSPLFIDLTDNYNQHDLSSVYINDDITGVPASVVWNIITNTTSWAECESKLQSYVGRYYAQDQLDRFIFQFVLWFATHPKLDY